MNTVISIPSRIIIGFTLYTVTAAVNAFEKFYIAFHAFILAEFGYYPHAGIITVRACTKKVLQICIRHRKSEGQFALRFIY